MTTMLNESRATLVRLSASVAARRTADCEALMRTAARVLQAGPVEEALIQSYLFLGYPVALNALSQWRSVSGQAGPTAPATDQAEWAVRGEEVCATVYGGQYGELRQNIRRIHPDMERWMVEEGYGKVLGRPGLDLVDRELCIIAVLAVLDVPRQLYSHLRGALNSGASEGEVTEALSLAIEFASAQARQIALETWATVRARSEQGD